MDWGTYVIVASILWPDGKLDTYRPTTRFDEIACFKEARRLNAEWHASETMGMAVCRKAPESEDE